MFENFGGNISFQPAVVLTPNSEDELLQLMDAHRGRRLRPIGRLHSWSETVRADDVLIDLRRLDSVAVRGSGETMFADIGAGCQIKRLVSELQRQGGFAPPSLGLIQQQAIAGAAATGTHGSGRHSLSHYVHAVRLATYDPTTGRAMIRTVDSGDELLAARCSLGCLGIVTQVTMPIRPQYQVEEHFRRYDTLDEVLAAEEAYPLQQFYLAPWRWDYFAQHRRESTAPRSWTAPLYRLYWSWVMDVALHLAVRLLARHLPPVCTRFFFRRIVSPLIPRGWKVVDRSDRQLTMNHELFRHIEIEIFVRRSHLADAVERSRRLVEESSREGTYRHHYPICIRKILPDNTLISPAAGSEAQYSLSFISYSLPAKRDGFFQFARLLAGELAAHCDGRPHWGKVCPLDEIDVRRLYPRLAEFGRIAREVDPQRAFGNEFTDRILRDAED